MRAKAGPVPMALNTVEVACGYQRLDEQPVDSLVWRVFQ
jgi:hypothetical protein